MGAGKSTNRRPIRHRNTCRKPARENGLLNGVVWTFWPQEVADPELRRSLPISSTSRPRHWCRRGSLQNVRARAGDQADRILSEEAFARLTETARWRTYPLGLAMVAEMIDGLLRPHADAQRALADETIDLVLGVFDRHPVPAAIGKNAWLDARSELAMRLDHISTQPPRNVADIPAPYIKRYLAEMPSHTGMTHSEAGAALDALKRQLVQGAGRARNPHGRGGDGQSLARRRRRVLTSRADLFLDEGFQSRQRVVPLAGHACEIGLRVFQRLWAQFEQASRARRGCYAPCPRLPAREDAW